jgi:hypothetical protein
MSSAADDAIVAGVVGDVRQLGKAVAADGGQHGPAVSAGEIDAIG